MEAISAFNLQVKEGSGVCISFNAEISGSLDSCNVKTYHILTLKADSHVPLFLSCTATV